MLVRALILSVGDPFADSEQALDWNDLYWPVLAKARCIELRILT